MGKKYIKPMTSADWISVQSALLTESYQGEKGGISDEKGSQEDFPVKEINDTAWGDLW